MSDTLASGEFELVAEEGAGRSLWSDACRRLRRNRLAMVCLGIIIVYVVVSLLVWFGVVGANWSESVGSAYQAPSWEHPLGTDIFGLSVFRKMLYGAKVSLTVAFVASVISIGIGMPLGAIAGYFGKRIDEVIVWLYSTLANIPHILLLLAFALVLRGKVLFAGTAYETPISGIATVYLAIGMTSWVGLCRLIRGEVIKHKSRDYVMAARAFGCGNLHIIFRHILPNVFHLVIIDFSLRFVGFIHAEVILSFLGLGAKDQPSWGVMIDDARMELARGVWWQMAAATLAIFLISLALNVFGDALRDAIDPRLRKAV